MLLNFQDLRLSSWLFIADIVESLVASLCLLPWVYISKNMPGRGEMGR